jgi:phosphatidylserine decarboxylase
MTMIEGEYYTVNPQAIRTSLDVYGENVRKVVPIQSEDFGLVMTVWIGAMSMSSFLTHLDRLMADRIVVGSILTSVEEGQHVKRTDELGYFAFGESTSSLSLLNIVIELCRVLFRSSQHGTDSKVARLLSCSSKKVLWNGTRIY